MVALLATGLVLLPTTSAEAAARPWRGHADRVLLEHTVRRGDTVTGLAVRFHAWTAELRRVNHLRSDRLYVGERLQIPVVVSAWRRDHPHSSIGAGVPGGSPVHATTPTGKGWRDADLSRPQVRRLVTAMARHYDVPVDLALAVAWQESGWQQRRVSSTGALGIMQVMPDTGRWMRWYAGRPLRLKDSRDNVQAGVLTLRVLRAWTRHDRRAIAAYYQGLGAVRRYGLYPSTRHYVRSVQAIQLSLQRTGRPV